jgi:Helix-turn-helix
VKRTKVHEENTQGVVGAERTARARIARNLRELMDLKGWSQSALERRSGVPQTTISSILDPTKDSLSLRLRTIEELPSRSAWRPGTSCCLSVMRASS